MAKKKSLEEIERKIKELQAEAEELKQFENTGIKELRALIAKYKLGLSHFKAAMEGIPERPIKRTTRTPRPKYCNPENKSEVWSGRGRRPAWITDALNAGKAIDDLLIEKPRLSGQSHYSADAAPTLSQ